MSESYTTTTTTTVVVPVFDPSYVRTLPGLLKVAQVVLDLLGFIAILTIGIIHSSTNFFSFVSMTGFWVTGILLLLYCFRLPARITFFPWLLVEFVYCAIWTLFYLIGSSVCASFGYAAGGFVAAAVFGFLATAAYGFDAYLKFVGWRNSDSPMSDVHVTTSSSSTPTAY